MQILALGWVFHFLPLGPPAHQGPHPILPTDLLWTRAICTSGVSEPWEATVAKQKGRRVWASTWSQHLPGSLSLWEPALSSSIQQPLSPSTCVCPSPVQNYFLAQNTHPALLQYSVTGCWFLGPVLSVQSKCNHLYARKIAMTLWPSPPCKGASAQEGHIVLWSQSVFYLTLNARRLE